MYDRGSGFKISCPAARHDRGRRTADNNRTVIGELRRLSSIADLQTAAASMFADEASRAIAVRGVFNVALSGGSTPRSVFSLLANDPTVRSQVEWKKVGFFWSDDRHVPPDHPDSNYRMAREAMLDRLPIDLDRVYRIKGEDRDAARAAADYETTLRTVFDLKADELPHFDLILLGMGSDGHTASLFPGTTAVRETRRLVVANHVPSLKTDRITLTAPTINAAATVLFLITGENKAAALNAVLEGASDPDRFPAQLVRPTRGRLIWLVDPSAARLLTA
jgi:6-phosphogluconolactonase